MEHISELLFKHLQGELSGQEHLELQAWADAAPENRRLLEEISNEDLLSVSLKEWYNIPQKGISSDARLAAEIAKHERRAVKYHYQKWLPYAAMFLIVSALGYWLFNATRPGRQKALIADIQPGGNKATLTLANGHVISLSADHKGIMAGKQTRYADNDEILEDSSTVKGAATQKDVSELILATPKGGTYQVVLEDGTKVWLNASSRLTYPVQFDADERVVHLEGEAYFEVKHDAGKPFRVYSNGNVVDVLGTAFNIKAYANESETMTTLVNGKVKISANQQNVVLAPGQQAIAGRSEMMVHEVIVDQEIAWKNGRFSFTGKSFNKIMLELERWYAIDIQYEGEIPSTRFNGDAKRSDKLSTVLRLLESGTLKYRLEGRRLTIINNAG